MPLPSPVRILPAVALLAGMLGNGVHAPAHAAARVDEATTLATVSERSGFLRTGRYDEVIDLCREFARGFSRRVRCIDFGSALGQPNLEISGDDLDDLRTRRGSSKEFSFTVNAVDAHISSAGSRPNHSPIIGVAIVPSTHF